MRLREDNLFKHKHQIVNFGDLAPAWLLFDYTEQPQYMLLLCFWNLFQKGKTFPFFETGAEQKQN